MPLRTLFILSLVAGALCLQSPGRTQSAGPWDLGALARTPAVEQLTTTRVKEGQVDVRLNSLVYAGETYMGRPSRVFAYYARPELPEEKKLPAMVLVHGGGGTAFPQWARLWAARGYAAIAMDLSGRGADRVRMPDGGPEQDDDTKFRRLQDGVRNAWSYHAVAAVLRAVSVLRSFPEVDRDRIGITGISWGGYLTSIAMSLDRRFKVAVPVYGCGFLHENSVWLPVFASLPAAEREEWVRNFDPSRYLDRCKIPVLWVNGTNDFAYPLDSYQKSYRLVVNRKLCVTVKMPHGHEAGWAPAEIGLFVDSVLRKGEKLASVSLPVIDGDQARITYDGDVAIHKAQIHWTTDLGKPWQQREWSSKPGEVPDLHSASAPLPAQRPAVFFLTLTDAHGAVVSTEHGELR